MNFFGSIRVKIFLCVAVAFLGFIGAAISTIQSNSSVSSTTVMLKQVQFPLALKTGETANLFRKQLKLYEDAFLSGDSDAYAAGNAVSQEILSKIEEMSSLMGKGKGSADKLATLKEQYTGFAKTAAKIYESSATGSVGETGVASPDGANIQGIQQMGLVQKGLQEDLDKLYHDAVLSVEEGLETSRKTVSTNSKILLVLFLVVLVTTIFVLNFVARRLLINPLRSLQKSVDKLASGDLDLFVGEKRLANDEIGDLADALHDMAGKLRQMVQKIGTASQEVRDVAHAIKGSSKNVGDGASLQAEIVEKASSAVKDIVESVHFVAQGVDTLSDAASAISSSILELTASTEEVAMNSEGVARLATEVATSIEQTVAAAKQITMSTTKLKEASDTAALSVAELDNSISNIEENARITATVAGRLLLEAEKGSKAVDATIAGIQEIKASSATTFGIIELLSGKAKDIDKILEVIDEVSEQTTLLALNANILAAQAGEHGRGFAVVANEIRELAVRTATSTKDVAIIIQGVKKETGLALTSIRNGDASIFEGEALSFKAGEALAEILQSIRGVAVRMDEIARGTAEQAVGSKVIRQSTENVSDMIRQIATATIQQQVGGEIIMRSTEQMKDTGAQMCMSTREQSQASSSISKSMLQITEMISGIKNASDKQNDDSAMILSAIDGVQTLASKNLNEAILMDNAVGALVQQTEVLQLEMGAFRITKK